MNSNACVILWKGEELPDYLVEKIAEILIVNKVSIPEMLTIKVMDEEAVKNALVKNVGNTIKFDVADNNSEAVKNAVIFIGKEFESTLAGTNLGLFAIELNNAVANAHRNMSFIGVGTNNELLTAIEIIATTRATIPQPLARKYHFTQNVVNVIKKVYYSY